ncbi:MAG: hypothetical protein KC503_06240 [Myxococcales bacterium]|nr:hypothetical protein [Myxococcales bacterium]
MRSDLTPIQLPLLLDPLITGRAQRDCGVLAPLLVGSWSGGERRVRLASGEDRVAGVWLHLDADGTARLRVRVSLDEHLVTSTNGGWYIEVARDSDRPLLTARFGHRIVRGVFSLRDDVLFWRDETFVRLPHINA